MSTIGTQLRRLRERAGLSQRELSERTRQGDGTAVGFTTISRLESGYTQRVRRETLERLADALGVEVDQLTDETSVDEGDRADIVSAILTLDRHLGGHGDADLQRARAWLQQVCDRHGW